MALAKKKGSTGSPPSVTDILATLRAMGSKRNRDGMAHFAISSPKIFGVSVTKLQKLAKGFGRNHALAAALWKTGWYEARMLAAFVDEPAKVTPAQMDRWAKVFDNWAICDTLCMHLFDRTPHAWSKVREWAKRDEEFVKRAAFALIASLALHDKASPDTPFLKVLPLIERSADDNRNFVKKAVNWALRGIGLRSLALYEPAIEVAARLAERPESSARWIGKDALRQLRTPAATRRLKRAEAARARS